MTSGGLLLASFSGLFEIDESNPYDLIATMLNDTEAYCGEYKCVDENGQGEAATATVSSKFKLMLNNLLKDIVFASVLRLSNLLLSLYILSAL